MSVRERRRPTGNERSEPGAVAMGSDRKVGDWGRGEEQAFGAVGDEGGRVVWQYRMVVGGRGAEDLW
ncbi:MAG: hypothetical protein AAF191_11910 [Verrucomicrobiota bacterium]